MLGAPCLPGEVVIGNTNLSTFHFTVSSRLPLPKPEASQKKKRESRRDRDEDRKKEKGKTGRSETVEGEGTQGNVFFMGMFHLIS